MRAIDRKEVLAVLLHAFRAKYPLGKEGFGFRVLQVALKRRNFEVVDMPLEIKLDINAKLGSRQYDSTYALGVAIQKFGGLRLDIIRRLISADVDSDGVTLIISSKADSINIGSRRSARVS